MSISLSIITSTYNCLEDFKETASSIRKVRHLVPLKWIVIDGGSNDGTQNEINKNKDIISYSLSELDSGIYQACNKALIAVDTPWIMFVGAGDLVNAQWLEIIVNNQESFDCLYSDLELVDAHKCTFLVKSHPWSYVANHISSDMCLPHAGMAINSSLFLKEKFDENYKIISDWTFLANLPVLTGKYFPGYTQLRFKLGGVSTNFRGLIISLREKNHYLRSKGGHLTPRQIINAFINFMVIKNQVFRRLITFVSS